MALPDADNSLNSEEEPIAVLQPDLKAKLPSILIGSGLFGGLLTMFLGVMAGVVILQSLVLPVFIGIFIALFFITNFGTIMNTRATEYRFYDNRVEKYVGFLRRSHKTLRYEQITDVTFSEGVWQRYTDTGTIKLNTAGSAEKEMKLSYIKNPRQTYNEIQQMAEQ